MDNLTHTLVGVAMANAGLRRKFGPGTTLVLALASILPDADALWMTLTGGDILDRRMFSHSVFGAPLLSLLAAALFRIRYRNISWLALFGLCLLAAAVHVFFDLINSFGVVLFYPLSIKRYELAWVFIVDFVAWALLLLPLLLSRLRLPLMDLKKLSRLSLIGVSLYLALCAAGRARAERTLDRIASEQPVHIGFSYVFPEALGPHRFRGVLKIDRAYQVYLIQAWSGSVEPKETLLTADSAPAVHAARATPAGQRLDWFFKAPVWRVTSETAEVFDLRFHSAVIRRKTPFVYRFKWADGKVEDVGWQK